MGATNGNFVKDCRGARSMLLNICRSSWTPPWSQLHTLWSCAIRCHRPISTRNLWADILN